MENSLADSIHKTSKSVWALLETRTNA